MSDFGALLILSGFWIFCALGGLWVLGIWVLVGGSGGALGGLGILVLGLFRGLTTLGTFVGSVGELVGDTSISSKERRGGRPEASINAGVSESTSKSNASV